MTEQERLEQIERYLKGQMSPEEQEGFEQSMQSDPDLADEVTKHQEMNSIIHDAGLMDVKKRVNALHHKNFPNGVKTSKVGSFLKYGTIGFSGLAIMGTLLWLNSNILNGPDNNLDKNTRKQNPNTGFQNSAKEDTSVSGNEEESASLDQSNKAQSTDFKNQPSVGRKALNKIRPESEDLKISIPKKHNTAILEKAPTLSQSGIKNPEVPKEKDFDACEQVQISADFETIASCKRQSNGKILIDSNSVYGGKPPYKFYIEEKDQWIEQYHVKGLASQSYAITILDDQGCSQTYPNLYVNEKACKAKKQMVFVPEKESKWEYPIDDNASGELIIRTRAGKQILKEQIRNGMPEGWNGRTEQGTPAQMGAYQVIFTPFNGQAQTWLLTVIR